MLIMLLKQTNDKTLLAVIGKEYPVQRAEDYHRACQLVEQSSFFFYLKKLILTSEEMSGSNGNQNLAAVFQSLLCHCCQSQISFNR